MGPPSITAGIYSLVQGPQLSSGVSNEHTHIIMFCRYSRDEMDPDPLCYEMLRLHTYSFRYDAKVDSSPK